MRDPDFEQFARMHARALLRLAYLLTRDHRDAEDLVQEVLLGSLRRWDAVAAADEPLSYIRKMLVNKHLSTRRRRSWSEIPIDTDTMVLGDPHSVAQLEAVDSRDWALRLMRELPTQQRVVLVLRYFERLDDCEIAEILGVARGTVRSLASRAFRQLRSHPQLARFREPIDLEPQLAPVRAEGV
jgi:RNA polymerase sigma-70 factor (sigma-E family)